ncbi:MAG: bifunctional chorismate mutase/prephenate dehydrogenase [Ignisphaera sp.]|uniref:Bifunctional chorismate mutase/prephenate dehydrogenase n=1 Tax=Ignisphaera aggregans TaxID=334771 RepID=A0A7J3MXX2_9CREN
MDIAEIRKKIDDIDRQIIELLSRRLELVKSIAEHKRSYGLSINDEAREIDLSIKWRKLAATYGVPPDLVEQILEEILKHSKKLQLDVIKSIDGCRSVYGARVAIVGYGKMGKALGSQIIRRGFEVVITGRDIDKAKTVARELGCSAIELEKALTTCNHIILALSLQAYLDGFVDIIARHMSGKIVMDILSSKNLVYEYVEKLSHVYGFAYVSTHPLFGPSTSAYGQKIAVIPSGSGKDVLEDVVDFWRCVGLDPVVVSYEEHEKAMAVVQVLTHMLILLFQLGVEELSKELGIDPLKLSTPTFRELTAISIRLNEIKDVVYEIQKNNSFSPLVHEKIFVLFRKIVERLGGRI